MSARLPPLDFRIPQWDLDDLIDRSCPICDIDDASAVCERPDGLTVRNCNKCNTFFVSPGPSAEQLRVFYEDYDERHRLAPTISPARLAASYRSVEPFADLRIRELSSLMIFDGSRVLDVGFGRANFLYCLKNLGASPFGLELDSSAIEFANLLGIDSFQGSVTNFQTDMQFDLISLLDFLEHPLNPMDVLRKCSDLLSPGGLLAIWTPNGAYSDIDDGLTTFRVDLEHMQYVTADSCLFIASDLDLRITHLESLGFASLDGIDQPLSTANNSLRGVKSLVRAFPGFSMINSLRRKLFQHRRDERSGSYHLFCILKKPA